MEVTVEPFCGAASVLLRKPPSKNEILNDLDGRIVNVFRVLRDPAQAAELEKLLLYTPYSSEEYEEARQPANDPVEDARRMMVLGFQSHGNTGTSGKRSGWRRGIRAASPNSANEWRDLHQQVQRWAHRLRGCYIENDDALSVIRRWDSRKTLFYIDPPYLAEVRALGGKAYKHEMDEEQHVELASLLQEIEGMAVVSGYRTCLYDRLYKEWRRIDRKALCDKGRIATESIWLSPSVVSALPQMDLFDTETSIETMRNE